MTTANMRLVPRNDHLDAVLTASATEVSGFEVGNTQNTRRNSFLRTVGSSSWSFTGVFPANRTLSHFSMWRHLNHAGSIKLELFTDTAASVAATPFASSGVVSAVPYTSVGGYTWSDGSNDPLQSRMPFYLWFAATVCRSYKVTFSGTPAQSYWQAGHFFLGRYFEFTYSPKWGMLRGFEDLSDGVESVDGSLLTNVGESRVTLGFDYDWIVEAEVPALLDMAEYNLTARPIVASAFAGDGTRKEAKHTVCGTFRSVDSIGRTSVNRLGRGFQIRGI